VTGTIAGSHGNRFVTATATVARGTWPERSQDRMALTLPHTNWHMSAAFGSPAGGNTVKWRVIYDIGLSDRVNMW